MNLRPSGYENTDHALAGADDLFVVLSTTPVGQSNGRSSLGHRVLILLMELPPTLQETSMWQEAPMEAWMAIPVQESMTSSWLSTTQVELSSGRSSLGHQVVILLGSYHRNLPSKIPHSCKIHLNTKRNLAIS